MYRLALDSQEVLLVDTPGFGDTLLSDVDVFKHLATWFAMVYASDLKISAILYCLKLNHGKFSSDLCKA